MPPALTRPLGQSLLLTVPMFLWSALLAMRLMPIPGHAIKVAAVLTLIFVVTLFFLTVHTGRTHRYRRIFFVTLGFLFPIGFIWQHIEDRGSMAISLEHMLHGDTPCCVLATPMMIVPAVLFRTIIFPGAVLPTATNNRSVAMVMAVWLIASVVMGKGWCSFGCFFGGIEEGFSAVARRPIIKRWSPHLIWGPWAVLVAVVLLSAATFEPTYCRWLCPFKTVTEFPEVRSVETALQAVIFVTLFLGLVVVLPLLTKRRTQCAWFCPFGAMQALANKINVFEVRFEKAHCKPCTCCQRACPNLALDRASIDAGHTLLGCTKCGACVDACPRAAARWHIKGTPLSTSPEVARLFYSYAAWGFASLFGGAIIATTLSKLLHFLG
ncbi:MAG: 4Fe-4S binding protein [Polyangiaceae bacterium]